MWLLVGLDDGADRPRAPRQRVRRGRSLGVCFVIGMFGQLLDLPAWVEDLSPFQHVPPYPAADLDVVPLVALVAITAGLTALGLAGLRRRDIGWHAP